MILFEMDRPFDLFRAWYAEAESRLGIEAAQTMCLATLGLDGFPDARMVLLKSWDQRGFVFYTNLRSAKGRALEAAPRGALVFHWDPLDRQVRVRGEVELVPGDEADRYFATRPRASRIAAWASAQSDPVESREALLRRVEECARQFDGRDIPRPPFWGGFLLAPREIEFWTAGQDRLHDRLLFVRAAHGWTSRVLFP